MLPLPSQEELLREATILLTVRERCSHLRRALDYYSRFPARVLVVDASDRPCRFEKMPTGTRTIHIPQTFFADVLITAFEKVETPYCLIASDDDFFLPAAISESVEFLREHEDYQCVQGYWGRFANRDSVRLRDCYPHLPGASVQSDSPEERVVAQLGHYMQTFHAVHRTRPALHAFRAARGIKNLSSQEVTVSAILAASGKMKILSTLYAVREEIFTAQSSLIGKAKTNPKFRQVAQNPEIYSALYQESIESISAALSSLGSTSDSARNTACAALKAYNFFYDHIDELTERQAARAQREGIPLFAEVMALPGPQSAWQEIREIVLKYNLSPQVPPVYIDDEGRTIRKWRNSAVVFYFETTAKDLLRRIWNFGKRITKAKNRE